MVYKNATHFCILILCPATLMNLLISFSSFLVASLGFSMYSIIPSANNDSFKFSFPILFPFICFPCLSTLARTSKSMLNKILSVGLFVLFLIFGGNSFHLFTAEMLAMGLSYVTFIMIGMFPLCSLSREFFFFLS